LNAAPFFVGACLLAAVLPGFVVRADSGSGQQASSPAVRSGFPAAARAFAAQALTATHLRDRPLTRQPLTALETRFAANFPGAIARFGAGEATVIVRQVTLPTRQLHPAADCFRAAGYTLGAIRTHVDARARRWNCFVATLGSQRWRVCERFVDASGRQWTDVSSWYWNALWSQRAEGAGPWWATTLVTPIESESEDNT
jgi:hypothetical protein